MNERFPVFESERITVWCYPQKGIIHHEMHGTVLGEVFRRALGLGIEAMKAHGGSKWLSDDRQNDALFPEDLKWADEVWFPRTVQAGWRYWALLPPTTVIGQMNIQRHIRLYKERGITVEIFSDPAAAMRWLESR